MWFDRRWALLALVGLILVGSSVFWWRTAGQSQPQIAILSTQSTSNTIYIDISGAVSLPGVYQLSAGSRVEDALQTAGGLTADADTKWIASHLNRAAVVTDGMKIYIPHQSDTLVETASEKIKINSASKSQLESLPGVGPVTAEKIIAGRPYQQIEDLLTKKIVSRSTFAKIQDLIWLW